MKGQIFIFTAIAITLALFFALPDFQQEIYLPDTNLYQLENIAKQYNNWIAYLSINNYNILDFGNFVRDNYSNLEFIYLLTENKTYKIANFFGNNLNITINDKNFIINTSSFKESYFQNEIDLTSNFLNFTYIPENNYSGAIFLRINKGTVKLELLKIFK